MNQEPKSLLARAIEIAASAHASQVDEGGAPSILHRLRMMMKQRTEAAIMAAVLHDVVEDHGVIWPPERLRAEGIPDEVLEAVACLTKREGEDYADFIARAGRNPIARQVKLADLQDNMDLKRIPQPTQKDFERLAKYRRSWETLTRLPLPYIFRDASVMGGTPVFTGTRVPIRTLIEHLEAGDSIDEFLEGFPMVKRQDVVAFLEAAAKELVKLPE